MPNSTGIKHRLVFFGSSASSALILEDLLVEPWLEVIAIVTQPPKDHAHTHQRVSRIAQLAQDNSIRLFAPRKLGEITDDLTQLQPTAGVLFAYGKILPDETLHIFPKGIVNIHPSLLPKHRGPAPLESTILAGDKEAGTSIMLVTSEMDAGPILAQKSFEITADIAKQELWGQLLETSRKLLIPTLRDYLIGSLTPRPQNESLAPTYSQLIKKHDGDIDPHTVSTTELTRRVRAYSGWPGTRLRVSVRGTDQPLTLHEVRIVNAQPAQAIKLSCENKQLLLHLTNGTIEIMRAQLPNKAIVTGQDICNAGPITLA